MTTRPRTLAVAIVTGVLLLAVPAIASAQATATSGCNKYSGDMAIHEEATANVMITEGDKTIAGGDLAEDASPKGVLTITVDATGNGIPSTFSATLNGRTTTGPAPGTADIVAPKAAGNYTVAIAIAAGDTCKFTLRVNIPISVGRGGSSSSSSSSGGNVDTPDDIAEGDDITAPTIVLRPLTAKRGHRLRFPYRVIGETDATTDTIDIRKRKGGAPIISTDVSSRSTGMRRATLTPPASAAAGKWWWCVTSLDSSGNESKVTCAVLTLR